MRSTQHSSATRNPREFTLSFLALLTTILAASPALASPVALVLDCDGRIAPAVEPYSEVSAGTRLKLERGARIEFLDYNSCMHVTETGGEVDFVSDGYKAKGGVQSQQRVACPQKLVLSRSGDISGNVLRGAEDGTKLPTRPNLILTGERRDDFATIRILKDGKEVMRGSITNYHFRWPAAEKSLDPSSSYELDLVPGHGGAPVRRNFQTVSDSDQQPTFVLVHTD